MLNKFIYVKYSELTLKKKNRWNFIKQLVKNVKFLLRSFEVDIKYYYDYLTIYCLDNNQKLNEIIDLLVLTPGINKVCIAYEIEKDVNQLANQILNNIEELLLKKQVNSFRLTCSRQDKTFQSSQSIISTVAGQIINKFGLKVSLDKFDINIQIEVKKDKIIVYDNFVVGINGLPIGSSGKTLLLLSGGIDSPVAAKLLMSRGMHVDFITFITPPHTLEQALQKVKDLVKTITLNNRLYSSNLYICNFHDIQQELAHIKKESYRITIMRRQFFKIAKQIALKNKINCIATGESLGQVASQTIESMTAISNAIPDFLVLRPLIAFNKDEIINLAQKFGTYNISILPYDDSCSLFAPKNPVTMPKVDVAIKLENECFLLTELIESTINNKIEIAGQKNE